MKLKITKVFAREVKDGYEGKKKYSQGLKVMYQGAEAKLYLDNRRDMKPHEGQEFDFGGLTPKLDEESGNLKWLALSKGNTSIPTEYPPANGAPAPAESSAPANGPAPKSYSNGGTPYTLDELADLAGWFWGKLDFIPESDRSVAAVEMTKIASVKGCKVEKEIPFNDEGQ
jgi:hypothetical protein